METGLREKKEPWPRKPEAGTQTLALPLRTCIFSGPQFSHLSNGECDAEHQGAVSVRSDLRVRCCHYGILEEAFRECWCPPSTAGPEGSELQIPQGPS